MKFSRGFTMVEILAYIAIVGTLMAIISVFLLESLKLYARSRALRETFYNGKIALDAISNEIKLAKSIYTPSTSSSQLSLELAGTPETGEAVSFVDFFLCQSALCVKREGTAAVPVTSDTVEVTSLLVQPVGVAGVVSSAHIDVQLRYKNPQNKPELDSSVLMSTVAAIRSY